MAWGGGGELTFPVPCLSRVCSVDSSALVCSLSSKYSVPGGWVSPFVWIIPNGIARVHGTTRESKSVRSVKSGAGTLVLVRIQSSDRQRDLHCRALRTFHNLHTTHRLEPGNSSIVNSRDNLAFPRSRKIGEIPASHLFMF